MRPLLTPPAASRDTNSVQMVNAWIAEKALHCSLNIGFFQGAGHNEPEAWGIVLADMVRHIANALHEEHGVARSETITLLLDSLHSELDTPTSDVQGEFHPRMS